MFHLSSKNRIYFIRWNKFWKNLSRVAAIQADLSELLSLTVSFYSIPVGAYVVPNTSWFLTCQVHDTFGILLKQEAQLVLG